jgi:hypothetical protein
MSITVAQNKSEPRAASTHPKAALPSNAVNLTTPSEAPLIQRKSACACGGDCPRCLGDELPVQAKLRISQPNDKYEQEADRVADQVMRMPESVIQRQVEPEEVEEETLQTKPLANQITPLVQRQVEPEEEEETLQTKPAQGQIESVGPNLHSQIKSLQGGGQPLSRSTRGFFEHRIGADFSSVRVHNDTRAARAAQSVNARAFTLGNDVVFGAGEYSPETSSGRKLLAHELTHVIQQSRFDNVEKRLQRMQYGDMERNPPPPHWIRDYNTRNVPMDDRERTVDEAIRLVRETVTNPEQYPRCHQFFQETCPDGTARTLREKFNDAVLWKADREDAMAFAQRGGHHVAYTQSGYNSGSRSLAVTLVHELMHHCGITGEIGEHHLADVAGLYCIGENQQLTLALGYPLAGSEWPILLYSYRHLLADISNGQAQLTAGVDINILGLAAQLSGLIAGADVPSSELGAIMTGLRVRGGEDVETGERSDWGGERFGGVTGRLEAGIGLASFRVREARGSEAGSGTEFGPGFVLQAGFGAEFYVPSGVNAIPLSVEATYRMIQPLNSEAERIHGLLLTVGLHL